MIVTSQASSFPLDQGIRVALILCLMESVSMGLLGELYHWSFASLCCLAALLQQERPCNHVGCTIFGQGQVCGWQVLTPSLRQTETCIISLYSLIPMELIGCACNQFSERGNAAANNHALSLMSDALLKFQLGLEAIGPSHGFWTCCSVRVGTSTDDKDFHMAIELVCDASSKTRSIGDTLHSGAQESSGCQKGGRFQLRCTPYPQSAIPDWQRGLQPFNNNNNDNNTWKID